MESKIQELTGGDVRIDIPSRLRKKKTGPEICLTVRMQAADIYYSEPP